MFFEKGVSKDETLFFKVSFFSNKDMTKQILLLKTSFSSKSEVQILGKLLGKISQIVEWSIDLEDCDKVLRIVSYGLTEEIIAVILRKAGFKAEKLI